MGCIHACSQGQNTIDMPSPKKAEEVTEKTIYSQTKDKTEGNEDSTTQASSPRHIESMIEPDSNSLMCTISNQSALSNHKDSMWKLSTSAGKASSSTDLLHSDSLPLEISIDDLQDSKSPIYHATKLLGAGLQAKVYKAHTTETEESCEAEETLALKVFHRKICTVKKEYDILQKLKHHPNIIKTHNYHKTNGRIKISGEAAELTPSNLLTLE